MQIAWTKVLPVVVSIAVIIFIAVVSESSRAVAAVTAAMPLTIPLSMWVVYTNAGGQRESLAEYADSLIVGFVATMAFLAGAWGATRFRLGLWQTIAVGYASWGMVLALGFLVRRLFGG